MGDMRRRGLGHACWPPCAPSPSPRLALPEPAPKKPRPARPRLTHNVRRAVDARDQRTCRWCGIQGVPIHRHHVRYRSQGGVDDVDNLLTLCGPHHSEAHSDKRRWQPVLLHVLAAGQEGRWLTVPEAEAELREASCAGG